MEECSTAALPPTPPPAASDTVVPDKMSAMASPKMSTDVNIVGSTASVVNPDDNPDHTDPSNGRSAETYTSSSEITASDRKESVPTVPKSAKNRIACQCGSAKCRKYLFWTVLCLLELEK